MKKIKVNRNQVIIDTDAGADDLLALHFALNSSSLKIAAVITTYGNFRVEDATSRVSNFLARERISEDLIFVKGCEKPLIKKYYPVDFIHGKNLLGSAIDYQKRNRLILSLNKRDDWIDKLAKLKGKFDYICIGPLTNLARLSQTSFINKISRIIILGGALFFPGNATPVSEANFYWDPEAVKKVLSIPKSIYIIPLNISERIQLIPNQISKLKNAGIFKDIFKEYLDYYINRKKYYQDWPSLKINKYKGAAIHDVLAVMCAKKMKLFKFKRIPLSLDYIDSIQGFVLPLLRPEHFTNLRGPNISCNIQVAIDIDKELFWQDFKYTLYK